MTLENNSISAAEAQRRKRREALAAVSPQEALEAMLLNAHRVAVTLGDFSIFQGELSVAEWAILKSLNNRQNVPLKEIATVAGVSRQRIRKLVSELEMKGLVATSKAEAQDKRARIISATPLAAKVLSLVSEQMKDLLPEEGKSKGGRPFAGAARALERVAKVMRRKWRKTKKAATGRGANEAGLDDDDDED
jgi:DNA-binding MarR family transcriptional regulator